MRFQSISCALSAILFAALAGGQALAGELMPSFSGVPTGWTTDRYAPDSFSDVGTFQGRSDVLAIGIGSNGAVANRPSGFSGQFYDTQGMGYAVSGGIGSTLSADLYLPGSWLDPSKGAVRSDMWGVMTDGTFTIVNSLLTPTVSDYPIIGFTNQGAGGYIGFRVWDDNLASGNGDWFNLGTTGVSDSWNSLVIAFTGTDFQYYLNGGMVYDQLNSFGSTAFQGLIMQAYNFDDPVNFPSAVANPYVAHWSNVAAVPEPVTLALFGAGLAGAVVLRRRRKTITA